MEGGGSRRERRCEGEGEVGVESGEWREGTLEI